MVVQYIGGVVWCGGVDGMGWDGMKEELSELHSVRETLYRVKHANNTRTRMQQTKERCRRRACWTMAVGSYSLGAMTHLAGDGARLEVRRDVCGSVIVID